DVQLHKKTVFSRRARGLDRRFPPLQQLVNVFLPTVRLNPLMEIALRINKTYTEYRNAKVAGFFAVIAGQNSQASGVNRQGSVESEFRGEIGNRLLCQIGKLAGKPFLRAVLRAIERFHCDFVFAQEIRITGSSYQPVRFNFEQELYGVVLVV